MLFLKVAKLIRDLTGVEPYELKPVTFGYDVLFEGTTEVVLASQFVPEQQALVLFRTQSYLIDSNTSDAGYQAYRAVPRCLARWIFGLSASDTTGVFRVTSTNTPGQLILDCDNLLLFPSQIYANLLFSAQANPPATGTWHILTTCFGFLVPPQVYDLLGGVSEWVNVQE